MLPTKEILQLSACFCLFSPTSPAARADFTPSEDGIYAIFDTTEGEIVAKLHFQEAPISCANFVGLAEGDVIVWNSQGTPVSDPFYDGLTFHSAIAPGNDPYTPFLQGGDPAGDGTGDPGYLWPDEVRPELTHEKAGTLSMANYGPNTNGSQFFFTLGDATETPPFFDGKHNVFGETIEGLDVLEAIANSPNSGEPYFLLDEPVTINSVTILRVGEQALAFNFATHLFPQRVAANVEALHKNQPAPILRIHSQPQSRYLVNASDDLKGWENIAHLAGQFDTGGPIDLDFTSQISPPGASKFLRVSKIQGHASEDRTGASLTITSGGGSYVETIELYKDSEGPFAIYTVLESSFVAEYRWYKLGHERDQLWVYLEGTNAATPEIQFQLTWTSETGGTAYIRDATPDYESDFTEDYVALGTFEYTE